MLSFDHSCTNKNYYFYLTNSPFCFKFPFFLCRAAFLCHATSRQGNCPGLLREQTSKQCLTWTLQPCQWHFPSTCMTAESLPWITSIFFPRLLGFVKAKKTNSTLLPASPHSPGHAMVPVWQLQPSLWHPTLSPQPTHLLWLCSPPHAAGAPKPEQQSKP